MTDAVLLAENLEAEESVLGAMLVTDAAVEAVLEVGLTDSEFCRERHRTVYRAIRRLHAKSSPIDSITVAAELDRSEELDQVGGKELLLRLANGVPVPGNARHHAQLVRESAWLRSKRAIGERLQRNGLAPDDAAKQLLALGAQPGAPALRTRGVIVERIRPIRWLWERRIPNGLPTLLVGEEGKGKGTFMSHVAAMATLGKLPGDLEGAPVNVLIIGDEDGFESAWAPRCYTAGADLTRLRTLDDGEYLDDLSERESELAAAVERDNIGLIVFDQILDHVAGGKDGQAVYNPKNIRQAMMPIRRVAGRFDIAAVSLLHPNKGQGRNFRELTTASHQFNAVARSNLFLAVDPDDERRRVVVRGKGNHSAEPRSFEFRIGVRDIELNDHHFEMPIVEDIAEGDRTIADFMSEESKAPVRERLEDELKGLLTPEPQIRATLANAVGRDKKDGSVGRALKQLEKSGLAKQLDDKSWVSVPGMVPVPPLKGMAPGTPEPRSLNGTGDAGGGAS